MFQLRQLKIFIAAVETLSFTQAAKRVHLSQPSVTEQIRALNSLCLGEFNPDYLEREHQA